MPVGAEYHGRFFRDVIVRGPKERVILLCSYDDINQIIANLAFHNAKFLSNRRSQTVRLIINPLESM